MKLILILLFSANIIYAQSDVPLTLRAQFNGSYDYTIIGNTQNQTDNQNGVSLCQMLTQSSATLNLLPTQNIVAAYLYWGGIGDGTLNPTIQLNGINYNATQTVVGYPENNQIFNYFSSVVNVTNQVQLIGNGTYNFSNLDLNPIITYYCSGGAYNCGWHIVIIYNEANLPNKQINIYDGINISSGLFNGGVTPLTINNLNVVDNQNAKMTYVGLNGTSNLYLFQSVSINNNLLSNSLNPIDNPFNSTNSFTGSSTNWNQDIDTFDISPYINIGDTQANLSFNSFFYQFIQTLVTSIRSELPDATIQINQVTGQEICNNRNLNVNYTVANTNSYTVLQVVPVSFYANAVLLQTVNTPSVIAVGGSLVLQTTIVIPANIPNTFDLKIIVDNNAANASTIAESNENNNFAVLKITLLGNTIAPTFNIANTFCAGANVPVLPSTSSNSIAGTWSPSVISNQNNGVYFFTPNSNQCANGFSLNTVIQSETPSQEKIEICFDENGTAIASEILDSKLNTNDYDFVWTKDNLLLNQTTSQITVLSIGNYKLVANPKISGCQKIINFIVNAIQPIKANISISEDFALESFIKIESSDGNGEYLYSFNNLSFQKENIYFVREGGDILIKIKDSSNCYDISRTITIWKYPAFFSPNNDGVNDTWNINTSKNIKVDIFDRFGKLIKQLKTGDNWDGTFNSQLLIANDYWFVIYYDENKIFKGHFALKR